MSARRSRIAAIGTVALLATFQPAIAPGAPGDVASDIRVATFFSQLHRLDDNYARLRYARNRTAGADHRLRGVIDQVLATELARFGRPGEAAARFPPDQARPALAPLPTATACLARPAAAYIASAAAGHRVVIVNEAHHLPRTRLLTLALLPRLRAAGFTHFAVEGLASTDQALADRGYPVEASGYYVGEPLYGEIVREALRLGFTLVAYEAESPAELSPQGRETRQAEVLQRILRQDPGARLFVHAGYAHADKAPGQLPLGVRPMASELARLTGVAPLSFDQTVLLHGDHGDGDGTERQLAASFPVAEPSVLVARADGHAWSFRPDYHDATVLLPASAGGALRPDWLALGGQRRPVALDPDDCGGNFPCLFEARYASEGRDAIPADQFVLFRADDARWPLYLRPGRYRLSVRGARGEPLASHAIEVAGVAGLHAVSAGATMAGSPPQGSAG